MHKKSFVLHTLLVSLLLFFTTLSIFFNSKDIQAQTSSGKHLTGYAWSDNIGWISFATSTNGNNQIALDSSGNITGYAWSDNIGWIKFGGLSNFPSGNGTVASNAKYDSVSGKLSGWARACAGTYDGVCGGGTYTYTPPPVVSTTTSFTSWTQTSISGQIAISSLALSSNGIKRVVGVSDNYSTGGYIYTSTDSGVTWTQRITIIKNNWRFLTSSSDGTKLAIAAGNGYIYTSTDSGATWTERTSAGQRSWWSITSSSDGTKLAAAVFNDVPTVPGTGYIYTSTDSGATWTQQTGAGKHMWYSISSSADGTKLIAVSNDGSIYTSTDSGVTWTIRDSSSGQGWFYSASSADGSVLAVAPWHGYIYTSTDYGASWKKINDTGSMYWSSLALSSDGNKLSAGTNANAGGGYLWSANLSVSTTTTVQSPITSDSRSDGWDGWISLLGDTYGVTKDGSGFLSGYAWGSDVLGWIDFSGGGTPGAGVSIADDEPICSIVSQTLNVQRGSYVFLGKNATVTGLPTGVTYNSTTGNLIAASDASVVSGQTVNVVFSDPCSANSTSTHLTVVSQSPTVTLKACRVAGSSECKIANGSITIPKNAQLKLEWSVTGSNLDCSGSSAFGTPIPLSGTSSTSQLQSTQSFVLNCRNTETGEVSSKNIKAVVYNVSEF